MSNTDNIPVYRTMVLGTEGSGKTVFMASMYQYLSVQHTETGFYLAGTPNQHRELINAFQLIRDPDKPWPATTAQVEAWDFTCQIRRLTQNFPVFDLTYYDYPGEVLTEEQASGSTVLQDFERNVASADTWLVILDGQKVKYWLDGVRHLPHRKTNIVQDLDFLLPYLQNNLRPTHFIITKWDLFESDSNGNGDQILREIRDALMNNPNFVSIVTQLRKAGMPARLIPVSAVGKQFVTPDSVTGDMLKNPGVLPKPYQVEMPIVFTLLDAFYSNHIQLTLEQRDMLRKVLANKLRSRFVSDTELLNRLPFLHKFKFSRQVLSLLLRVVEEDLLEKTLEQLQEDQENAAVRVNNRARAIKAMVMNYAVIAKKLIEGFPSSDLNSELQ